MAVLVGEPILEHESRRRVERKHPPPAVVPVAFRTRHVVTNRAPRHKVVVDERHWVRRRTPPTFQLPRVGPQLPNPSDIGVKLGRYRQSESIEILLHVNNSHPLSLTAFALPQLLRAIYPIPPQLLEPV